MAKWQKFIPAEITRYTVNDFQSLGKKQIVFTVTCWIKIRVGLSEIIFLIIFFYNRIHVEWHLEYISTLEEWHLTCFSLKNDPLDIETTLEGKNTLSI